MFNNIKNISLFACIFASYTLTLHRSFINNKTPRRQRIKNGQRKMNTYLISSPAYKANGYHGTYYSIAICQDNGQFIKIIGDHGHGWISNVFHSENYKNINQIAGLSFSDADRFISIKAIKINEELLSEWEIAYTNYINERNEWDKNRLALTNGDPYTFLYNNKGKKIAENHIMYDQWIKENPAPKSVSGYDFLKAVIHEN